MVIVAAVDRSARAPEVVEQAERLAVAFDDEIHVVHVLSESEFVSLERTSVNNTGNALDMDRVREVAATVADEAASSIDSPTETVGIVGDPSDRILEYADDQNARYIVVASRKRSPAGKVLFGSVAQSVLLNAGCPVVVSAGQ
ncbi:universal stress protein [Halostagnicola sp. A-GB9-2]|uniref:universal stress protein n=1 Tax=Halostagnicola sp. A-GB9-2 TaxID=3048066 RepID=UPI0024BFB715|nr:universal stress protein [Halostagnicola sp. A-GB9-2]MDJ1434811.1 universal stress protein [Halostagnicola sp. A-GB9-2]